jgi:tetratricopeptide (TPR) repeat protein
MLYTKELLKDANDRRLLEKLLAGKAWEMNVQYSDKEFTHLTHRDFKTPVYFPFRSFGINRHNLAKEYRVEVMVGYNPTKREYDYNVKRLIPADSEQHTPAAPEKQNTSAACSQKISDLKPSRFWDILIDETGSKFKNTKQASSQEFLGKFVALLVPMEEHLPPLKEGWHAVKSSFPELSKVIGKLHNSNCGIVGISVTDLPKLQGDLWSVCLRKLIDLVLLLIPCNDKTTLHLYVEEHGRDKRTSTLKLEEVCESALLQLANIAPEKAKLIAIVPEVISKTDDFRNGYVDAIAYCWGSESEEKAALVQDWIGPCLWTGGAGRLIELMTSQRFPKAIDWSELILASANSRNNAFLIKYLEILSKQIVNSKEDWIAYLKETRKHLESKNINQKLLNAQIKWLKASMPEDIELTPPLHLLWLISELADANHVGKILDDEFLEDFTYLCDDLVDEDATLVAWADLNLAVAYTNAFDFESARNVMARWQGVAPGHPGRQYYGQILSTLGQLSSFVGRQREAVGYFENALEYLTKNSYLEKAESDKNQTMTYQVIAMMDDEDLPKDQFDKALEKCLMLEPKYAALIHAVTPDVPYTHHVLLRAITYGNYPEAREAYLSKRDEWLCGAYHPWELIEFYRGLMFDAVEDSLPYLRNAYEIAMRGDATMHVIGAVILGSIYLWDKSVKETYVELVEKLTALLPKLGTRAQILREQVDMCRSAQELAKLVLPFNFR